MAINFPSDPALDDLFTDSSNVEWQCIDATVGDVQWARTGKIANFDIAPIGSILAWPAAAIPAGWLECNGQVTAAFPDLAAVVGANVPDLRGEFIRGFDNGAGNDPEAGRVLGSNQTDEFEGHSHFMMTNSTADNYSFPQQVKSLARIGSDYTLGYTDAQANESANNLTSGNTGGTETRPRNIALIYIIKAYNAVTTTQGVLFPNKNYIINPTFSINQRGFAGGVLPSGQYTFDRWKGGVNNDISLPDANGFITMSALVPGDVQHRVEAGIIPVGVQATLSWEGTALVGEYVSNGNAWDVTNTSPFTFTVADVGVVADVNILFGFSNGTLKNVKLEVGSVATPFEYPDPATELTKCQRYYCFANNALFTNTLQGSSSILDAGRIYYPVTMRTTPIFTPKDSAGTVDRITKYSATNASQVHDISINKSANTSAGISLRTSGNSGDYYGYVYSWVADAEL